MNIKKILLWPFQLFWSFFLNGLITLLPIAITIAIFAISFRFVQSWLEPFQQFRPNFLKIIPYSEFLIVIAAIFFVGIILRIIVFRSIVHSVENIIAKIPLIRPVYTGIKQLVQAFSVQDKISFKKVVLIEFPRKGMYSVGFLTNEMAPHLAPNNTEKYYGIFVPTTPTPLSGFLVILKENQFQVLDLSHQEAMALIISGGIIQPDRFKDPI